MRTSQKRFAAGAAVAVVAFVALELIWPSPPGVVAQGVIIGALTSLISFGIALVYRSSRVVNFAQADLGIVPAAVAVMLMTGGDRAALDGHGRLSYWIAVPIALVLAVVLGALVERLVIRRFAKAPRLIVMVVTIGLAQILAGVGVAIPYFFGSHLPPQRYPSPFDFHFEIHPIIFRGNDLIAVVASGGAIAALMAFLRYTDIGIAIRASAESSDRASLLGINVGRTQNTAWIVATVLSTIAMIVRAGILGLPLGSAFGPTILLRALAAAVIGRMDNFGVMFAAACGIGIVEAAVIWNEGSATLVDPAVFVVVIGALLLQRRRKESRAEDQALSSWEDIERVRAVPAELRHLPEVRWVGRVLLGLLAGGVVALPAFLSDGDINLAAAVFIYAIIAVSLVVLIGWAGEISLGQVAFVGIGAAVAGSLNVHFGWDLTLTTLSAAVVGGLCSIIIGLPALRIRGLFLAVSTMAFALATSSFLLNRNYFHFLPDNATERVTRFPLLGHLGISSETAFYYVCAVSLVLVLWTVRGLERSRVARVLVATRENERGAQALGISATRAKLLAFGISGFVASFAGGLFAIHQQAVGQDTFAPVESIRVLTMVVVGGLGSVPGAILGAVFLKSTEWFNTVVPQEFRFLFTFAGSGVGLIVVLWFAPGGLGAVWFRFRDRYLRWVAARRRILVPSLVADAADTTVVARRDRPHRLTAALARVAGRRGGKADRQVTVQAGAAQLVTESVDVAYGQVQVLFGVDLEVREGQIIALLGTNGAGKSTVLRAISGLASPSRGSIWFDGVDISGMAPHKIAALGLVQVPGGRGIFPGLTVAENLRAASWMYRRDRRYVQEATQSVLDLFPVLRDRLDEPAANLSGGQQQMLTVGMAFVAKPRVLMIDELSLGLAPVIVEQLLDVVRQLRDRGTTVVVVEQSVNVALTIADTAYFMEKGEVKFHGPTADLLDRPDVLRSVYLEGAASRQTSIARTARGSSARWSGGTVLEAERLTKSFAGVRATDGVSFQLHEGEILGIIGPNGAGKTTLFDLLSGFLTPDEGHIRLEGRDVTSLSPDRRSMMGLARSFQDARLFGALTVADTIAVALDREIGVRDPLAAALHLADVEDVEEEISARVGELIDLFGLGAFRDKFVSELSTGSRRVVDLACQVAMGPRAILFDEPSSGIAQREAEALGPLLRRIRDETGAGLLVIEHDMPLVTGIADRIIALNLGAVVVEGDADTVLNDPDVVASYLGSSREAIERSLSRPRKRKKPLVAAR